MGVNENRQSGLDEAVQVGSTAAKVVEGTAKAGKITAAAANGAALGGPYGAAASVAIAAARHGKKILLALLAILAIPLLFLVMLPTLIFGGTAQTTGDTTILNDQTAITENMNEIAFAVSDLLGSGIADAEQRIAVDFAASSADQYEIVNPYENEHINNVNLFISQYCAYRDADIAAISLENTKQLLRSGIGELYDYSYEDEMREVEETVLNEDGEEVTELREVTVRVYTLTYRGEAYFADSIFHLTAEQKTLAQNFAENLSLFLGDGLFQNLSSSESGFTIPALGDIRYTDGSTEVVYYNQLDERYANKPYGTDNIGGYGCGPTAMAMVVSSLTDDLVDPVEMAKWSYDQRLLVQWKRFVSRAHPGGCRSVGSSGFRLHRIGAAADHRRAFQRQAGRRHHVRRAFYLVRAFHCAARRQGRKDPRRRSSQPDAERTELGAVHYSE